MKKNETYHILKQPKPSELIINATEKTMTSENPSQAFLIIARDYWEIMLKFHPTLATHIGDHRYDSILPNISEDGIKQYYQSLSEIKNRLSQIPLSELSQKMKISHALLIEEVSNTLAFQPLAKEYYALDQLDGPQIRFIQALEMQPKTSFNEVEKLLQRMKAFPSHIEQYLHNISQGIKREYRTPKIVVDRIIRQIDQILAIPEADGDFSKLCSQISPDLPSDLKEQCLNLIRTHIYPSFQKFHDFLQASYPYLVRETVGIWDLPHGEQWYELAMRSNLGLEKDYQSLHEFGQNEIKRIWSEIETIAKRHQKKDTRAWLNDLMKIRTFKNKENMMQLFSSVLKSASAELPKYFSLLPQTSFDVLAMQSYREQDSPAAYYFSPAIDGSRNGIFYVNTFLPEIRETFTAKVLAFHEAVPGHHLQIAIAQEIRDIPDFQKHLGITSFVEGWALYSEGLAQEMGLYQDDFDMLGRHLYDMWRALRLVVDTGIHGSKYRFTRQQAVELFQKYTTKGKNEIENEIDRYIVWPAQALAYKVGEQEILRLRKLSQESLKEKFDIKEFHRVVLQNGAVPLSVLHNQIEEFIQAQSNTSTVSNQ